MPDASLENTLLRWIRRDRLQRGLNGSGYGALAGGILAVLLALYTLLSKNVLAGEYLLWAGSAFVTGLLAGFILGWGWPVNRQQAARRLDLLFDLKERTSTAFEIMALPARTPLQEKQIGDATRFAAQIDFRRQMPLRPRGRTWKMALVLAAGCLGFWFAAGDLFSAARQARAIQDTIGEEAARVEALIEQIKSDPELTEAQKDVLLAPLEQGFTELEQARSLEEAFSTVEQTREQLQALEDPGAAERLDTLRQAGEALANRGAEQLAPAAEQLAAGDLQGAADALRDIDVSELTDAERTELAEELGDLAEAVGTGDQPLSEALQQAAQAAANSPAQASQEALQRAAEALDDIQSQNAASQAASEAAAGLEQAQNAIVQAGQAQQEGQASGGSGQEAAQSGQGQQASSGSGEGSGNSGSQTGSEAGSAEISQENSPDGAGQSSFEPIAPTGISGEGSDWVAVPPSGETGENIIGVGPSNPGTGAPLTVPYSEVFARYQAAVNQAIDSGLIPPQYRSLIRDYFSALEP